MSFPHRTAFYDRKKEEIWGVKKSSKNGLTVTADSSVKDTIYGNDRERFTPLAFTGLEDSEGNEIFEGHIVKTRSKPSLEKESNVVVWMDGSASFSM